MRQRLLLALSAVVLGASVPPFARSSKLGAAMAGAASVAFSVGVGVRRPREAVLYVALFSAAASGAHYATASTSARAAGFVAPTVTWGGAFGFCLLVLSAVGASSGWAVRRYRRNLAAPAPSRSESRSQP